MSAVLPIVERLTRTPANSNRIMPVNPDGPKAARIVEELYEALRQLVSNADIARAHLPPDASIVASALFDTISQAQAALAKASGEQQ